MAIREENLKKIKDELELMSDEKLEQVAGGTIDQTVYDSMLLYDYGMLDTLHGVWHTTFH